jgi:hypothetical protein
METIMIEIYLFTHDQENRCPSPSSRGHAFQGSCLSYDFSCEQADKEPLGEGAFPPVSGGGRIGIVLAV